MLSRHIAAIEAGVDPSLLAVKMKAAQASLAQAEATLASHTEAPGLDPEVVRNVLMGGEALPALLAVATPDERRRIYSGAGISLTYKRSDDGTEVVRAALAVGFWCVGEGTKTNTSRSTVPKIARKLPLAA